MYFSGVQGTVYVNGNLVDDNVSIEWISAHEKTPIFSFSSQLFDRVARGQYHVRGAFTIAFRRPGYLLSLAGNVGPRNTILRADRHDQPSLTRVESDVMTLDIHYGHEGTKPNFYIEKLVDVHILSFTKVLKPDGAAIEERYEFIARGFQHSAAVEAPVTGGDLSVLEDRPGTTATAPKTGEPSHNDIMNAIGQAESGGNPRARGSEGHSMGYMQISDAWIRESTDSEGKSFQRRADGSLDKLWIAIDGYLKPLGGFDYESKLQLLFDQDINRGVAEIIYDHMGYTSWVAYNNGSYLSFLPH